MQCDETGIFPLLVFLPKSLNLREKASDKSKLRNMLQNTWPVLLKTVKVIKNKESLRNCHGRHDNYL